MRGGRGGGRGGGQRTPLVAPQDYGGDVESGGQGKGEASSFRSMAFGGGGGGTLGGVELPSKMKVLSAAGKLSEVTFSGATKLVHCLGLPEPPGGWYGPFGFFRIVSYAFALITVLGGLFALNCLLWLDGFGFLASVLLSVAAVVSGIAAYSHEGLANEVTELGKQNDLFAEKNEMLQKQVKQLGGVADQMTKIQGELGITEEKLKDTIDALHRQTSVQQLASMLNAFCEADRDGDKDQRLTKTEVDDFFDSSNAILKGACPTFDFQELKQMSMKVGVGLYAMRLMVNALVASADDNPHKSTAELSLVMFCFDPEGHLDSCVNNLRLVLTSENPEALRGQLMDLRKRCAIAEQGGRIPCKEVHDLSHRIMSAEAPVATTAATDSDGPAPAKSP